MKRRFSRALAVVFLLAGVVVVAAFFWLLSSLPQHDGRIALAGIDAPVEIVRDANAIPHIFAASSLDAYFALGFVHAQDRLWQLEMNRRIGSGRLAEIFGAAALDQDKFLRTLGVRRAAVAIHRNLDPATQARLQAYADGINAYLANQRGALPPEFVLLRVRPQSWTPQDSVAWQLMMAWDLSGNWSQELLRLRLSQRLDSRQIAEFLPPYPGDQVLPLPDLRQLYAGINLDAASLIAAAPPVLPEGAGSNNWVVAGSRAGSGKPLLANDPHLSLTAPAIWYFAHLHTPDLKSIGATLPGIPTIVLGRNERIAWGYTNTGPDTQDLYVEKIDPSDASRYLTPQGWKTFEVITERIAVKDAADVLLNVRVTRHGPVISDVIKRPPGGLAANHVLAFAWTALAADDRTIVAGDALTRAGTWQEFLVAARDFHAPQQNIVYADVDGNIGFVAPARVPLRKAGNDLRGLAPAPGWDAKYDWAGFIPFDQLPLEFNPADGKIVTANHKIVADNYPHFITSEWAPPYRALRIDTLLDAVQGHTVESFASLQADTLSLPARALLPHLLAVKVKGHAAEALALMQDWDGRMLADRPEPLLFNAWLRELTRLVYADELGDVFANAWDQRIVFIGNVLANSGGGSRWCDDVDSPPVETCATQATKALELAVEDLGQRYGNQPRDWRWGDAHAARSAHRPLSGKPVVGALFDITVPTPGDTFTVNVGRHRIDDEAEPYANRHAASLRAIYDFADLDRSVFIHSTGQSGNRLSAHYDNFADRWGRVEYLAMSMRRETVERGALGTLTLIPMQP